MIVVNKIDITPLDQAPAEAKEAFERYISEGIDIMPMSTLTDEGVMNVKLQVRVLRYHAITGRLYYIDNALTNICT